MQYSGFIIKGISPDTKESIFRGTYNTYETAADIMHSMIALCQIESPQIYRLVTA